MQKWLGRLSFSLMILAAVLAWDAYKAMRGIGRELPLWRINLQFLLAAFMFGLGLAGVKARHRYRKEDDEAPPPGGS